MSGYGQGTYTDLDPTVPLVGESPDDFFERSKSETSWSILRWKGTVPILYFTLNYLTAHPRGRRLMGWTQAILTYYEATAFMDWLVGAIDASERDTSGGPLGTVDANYWFTSPDAEIVFLGRLCIIAKAVRLLQRAFPVLGV